VSQFTNGPILARQMSLAGAVLHHGNPAAEPKPNPTPSSPSVSMRTLRLTCCWKTKNLWINGTENRELAHDNFVEATVAKLHREHRVRGFVVGDCAS
jgi:hypothetical protein